MESPDISKRATDVDKSTIDFLVKPMERTLFYEKYWEIAPCFISRKDDTYFSDTLVLSDMENVIAGIRLFPHDLRMTQYQRDIRELDYVTSRGERAELEVDPDKVFWLYSKGATIILNGLNRFSLPIAHLTRGLERETSCHVQANVYVTPPCSQGFAAHWDTHDVFILQIAGSKLWTIRSSPLRLPLRSQSHDPETDYAAPVISELTLHCGDTLYIPRGFIHEAVGGDEISAHITVGIHAFTWADLVQKMIQKAAQQYPEFRESLVLNSCDYQMQNNLRVAEKLINKLVDSNLLEDCISDEFEQIVGSRRAVLPGQLALLSKIASVNCESLLNVRRTILFSFKSDKTHSTLSFHGKIIKFPSSISEELQFIVKQRTFSIAELPGELNFDGKLTLLKRLLREGFLEIQ